MSIVHPSITDFDQLLQKQSVVLVDFWANGCGPCLLVEPMIEELAAEYDGKVTVARVDVDVERALAEKYNILTIPTMLVFKNGQLLDKKVGAVAAADYEKLLLKALE